MKVFKFGGASVKDAGAVRNLAKIIDGYDENLVVVVSAMGKTTDLLENLVRAYFNNNNGEKQELFEQFKNNHLEICYDLFGNSVPEEVLKLFSKLGKKLEKPHSLDYNFDYDSIVSFGELISSLIVSRFLNVSGKSNQWIDARTVIKTDDMYRAANIDWTLTERFCKKTFDFNGNSLYFTQGFIGSTRAGLTTTLGREGSDYTAAIIGNVLNAESVSFWKDVPGVLSADPKKMESYTKIDELSYREAVEMTHSGAKIIHPKTMKPLHNKRIPLYVKSFLEPQNPGTVIYEIGHRIQHPPIFILRENQVLITLSPKDFSFINIEDIDRVVNFLVENRIKVTLMQQSAIDLNLVIDARETDWKSIMHELKPYYNMWYNTGLTLITIRHYTEEVLDWMVREKDIYLEQHSRLTARMLVKE